MKSYKQFIAESTLNESDDLRRMTFLAKKEGFEFTPIKKVNGTSFKVGNYTFGNKGDGQWQIVNKAGNEVDYLFNTKLGDVAKRMKEYSLKEDSLNEAKETFTDYESWKKAVLKKNPKAEFTKEGAGGSEFVIGSTKGSPQQTGKWMGPESAKKGTGYVY